MTARRLIIALAMLLLGTAIWGSPAAAKEHAKSAPPPAESRTTTAVPVSPPAPPDSPEAPPAPESSSSGGSDRVGVGEYISIPAGQTHDGDVVCVGGHATIAGNVNGTVTVVGGTLDLTGTVNGDVVTVASRAKLGAPAVVEGNLVNVAGSMDRSGATVNGQVVNIPLGITLPSWGTGWTPGWSLFSGFFFWWKLFAIFLFFVCALLLSALVPDRIRLISEETPVRFFSALLAGLVGYMILVMVQVFLAVTIIGIPLVFLLYLVFVVLKWLAMCGVFHQVGSRMGRALGREMSLLGAILLGLLPFALLRFAPFCIGWSVWFLVEILGFGYLILTRVGTRGSVPFMPPAPMPPFVPPSDAAPRSTSVPPAS